MRKLILFILYCTTINAQIIEPVKWDTSVKKENDAYIFKKKHEHKVEVFEKDYLDNIINNNNNSIKNS